MTFKDIQHTFHQELATLYSKEEINRFFYLLIESYHEVSRMMLALNPSHSVDSSKELEKALSLLKKHIPIQYILGGTEFYGSYYKVNRHTLIPRPETEELVAWVIALCRNHSGIRIIDIGTGSGCIAVSLAKHLPDAQIYALDVSSEALQIASENARTNGVSVEFIQADILNTKTLNTPKFDVIVSNPPYVRKQEASLMKPNVLQNEPHVALFVENDNPLLFYKAISAFAVDNLSKKGTLFFEINEYLAQEMKALMQDDFSQVVLKRDIFRKDRMIKGVLNQ